MAEMMGNPKLKQAMGLAAGTLAQGEPDADDAAPMPPKVRNDMVVRQLHDKTFHITHRHKPPYDMKEHDMEHSVPDMKALHAHFDTHFAKEK